MLFQNDMSVIGLICLQGGIKQTELGKNRFVLTFIINNPGRIKIIKAMNTTEEQQATTGLYRRILIKLPALQAVSHTITGD